MVGRTNAGLTVAAFGEDCTLEARTAADIGRTAAGLTIRIAHAATVADCTSRSALARAVGRTGTNLVRIAVRVVHTIRRARRKASTETASEPVGAPVITGSAEPITVCADAARLRAFSIDAFKRCFAVAVAKITPGIRRPGDARGAGDDDHEEHRKQLLHEPAHAHGSSQVFTTSFVLFGCSAQTRPTSQETLSLSQTKLSLTKTQRS